MPKLIIRREKKEKIKGKDRVITTQRIQIIRNPEKDYHSTEGVIKAKDLSKKDGSTVKSHTGQEFVLLTPSFVDMLKNLKKFAQTPPMKDMALIAAETGMNKDSVVLDAGAGSGHMAIFFAHICKKVVTCDIRSESLDMTKQNIKEIGTLNLIVKELDIYKKSPGKNFDIVTLDLPEPWNALTQAVGSLKIGGYLVSYLPSIVQVKNLIEAIKKEKKMLILKTVEVIERPWKVEGLAVRPKNTPIGHSAFLVFTRRIQ